MSDLDNVPPECTCLWSCSGLYGAIYLRMPDCPVWPHPRTYRRPDDQPQPNPRDERSASR